MAIDIKNLHEYLSRDWGALRRDNLLRWQRLPLKRRLLLAEELRAHAHQTHPEWPTPRMRREDFQHHLALRSTFDKLALESFEQNKVFKPLDADCSGVFENENPSLELGFQGA